MLSRNVEVSEWESGRHSTFRQLFETLVFFSLSHIRFHRLFPTYNTCSRETNRVRNLATQNKMHTLRAHARGSSGNRAMYLPSPSLAAREGSEARPRAWEKARRAGTIGVSTEQLDPYPAPGIGSYRRTGSPRQEAGSAARGGPSHGASQNKKKTEVRKIQGYHRPLGRQAGSSQ